MGLVDTGGPSTADESHNLDDMAVGILGREQQLVKYSKPIPPRMSLSYALPESRGFYSKNYAGIESDRNQHHNIMTVDLVLLVRL